MRSGVAKQPPRATRDPPKCGADCSRYLWHSAAISGDQRYSEALSGTQRRPETVSEAVLSDTRWHSMALDDTLRSTQSIAYGDRNQTQSEASENSYGKSIT